MEEEGVMADMEEGVSVEVSAVECHGVPECRH